MWIVFVDEKKGKRCKMKCMKAYAVIQVSYSKYSYKVSRRERLMRKKGLKLAQYIVCLLDFNCNVYIHILDFLN